MFFKYKLLALYIQPLSYHLKNLIKSELGKFGEANIKLKRWPNPFVSYHVWKKWNINWMLLVLFPVLRSSCLKQRTMILILSKILFSRFYMAMIPLCFCTCVCSCSKAANIRGQTALWGVHSRRRYRNTTKLFILKKLFPKVLQFPKAFLRMA